MLHKMVQKNMFLSKLKMNAKYVLAILRVAIIISVFAVGTITSAKHLISYIGDIVFFTSVIAASVFGLTALEHFSGLNNTKLEGVTHYGRKF